MPGHTTSEASISSLHSIQRIECSFAFFAYRTHGLWASLLTQEGDLGTWGGMRNVLHALVQCSTCTSDPPSILANVSSSPCHSAWGARAGSWPALRERCSSLAPAPLMGCAQLGSQRRLRRRRPPRAQQRHAAATTRRLPTLLVDYL